MVQGGGVYGVAYLSRARVIAIFLVRGSKGRWPQVLTLVGNAVVFGLVAALLVMLTPQWHWKAFIIAVLFLFLALIAAFMWKRLHFKRVWISFAVAALLVAGFGVSSSRYDAYLNRITVGDNVDYELWDPTVEDSRVAVLDEEPTLRLTDHLPRLDGATALYPVYAAFANAVYPEDRLNEFDILKCSTTTWAYQDIVDGGAEIVFCAAPSAKQLAYAEENGVELELTPIGREAFVFFVNEKNPLENLTLAQVRGIWSGRITEWSELGVPSLGKIHAFQRDEGSGSQSALIRLMGDTPLMDPPTEDVVDVMEGIITRAADYRNYKNAIGYSFRFYSTVMHPDAGIKLLALEGVAPTIENIENGSYPVASYFYAVTRKDADENTRRLVEWITGPQGQELIAKTGYTPVGAEAR